MEIKITKKTTVQVLKENFHKEYEGTLRVYDGRSEAADDVLLVSIGSKEGSYECRGSKTVGGFCEDLLKELNLKVKVATVDNWVIVLDNVTLATIKDIPKQCTKAQMDEFVSYRREEREKSSDSDIVVKTVANIEYPSYEECILKYPASKKGGDRYTISEDGKILTPSEAFKGSLIIPEGIEILDLDGRYRNDELTALIMPDSIKEMKGYLEYCVNLKFVRLSRNLTEIPENAFNGIGIEEISLPEGIRIIGKRAFSNINLKSLNLPETVEYILPKAFYGVNIENLVIPKNVKVVCDGAFEYCKNLKEVKILSKNTVVAKGAFRECGKYDKTDFISNFDAEKIYEEHAIGNKTIGAEDVRYEEIDGYKTLTYVPLYYCGVLKIEDGTKRIKISYPTPRGIIELWFPDSMAEEGCGTLDFEKVETIHFPSSFESASEYQRRVEISSTALKSFNFPKGTSELKLSGAQISELEVPEGVKKVSIICMKNLRKLTLPTTLEALEMYECEALETLIIPNKVTFLPYKFCAGCKNLKEVELPSNLESIGQYAFSGCESLTKITIPASVQSIESDAFSDCKNLTEVNMEGKPKISPIAFKNCPGYTVKTSGLTTFEWDDDGLPVVTLKFQRIFFRECSYNQAMGYLEEYDSYEPGIFIACGSNDFCNYPFDKIKYLMAGEGICSALSDFYYADEDACSGILGYGNILYAGFDSEDYPWETQIKSASALETILDVPQDNRRMKAYEGPEAIFNISIVDDPYFSEEILFEKRFRIYKDDNGNWTSVELSK